jgi:DNA-binding NarL/FixJ family response regulator
MSPADFRDDVARRYEMMSPGWRAPYAGSRFLQSCGLYRSLPGRAAEALLTRREREVFELVVAGEPNKVIAGNLGISFDAARYGARVLR